MMMTAMLCHVSLHEVAIKGQICPDVMSQLCHHHHCCSHLAVKKKKNSPFRVAQSQGPYLWLTCLPRQRAFNLMSHPSLWPINNSTSALDYRTSHKVRPPPLPKRDLPRSQSAEEVVTNILYNTSLPSPQPTKSKPPLFFFFPLPAAAAVATTTTATWHNYMTTTTTTTTTVTATV